MTEARRIANRNNAQKSTGPKTEAGKARSRCNAVKHGLRAEVVAIEDPALVQERTIGVYATIKPQNAYQAWACGRVALFTVRLDRAAALEAQVRAGAVWQATAFWEDDQRREADRIAARLGSDPSRTVGQLRRSVAGCDWLIEQWALLAAAAREGKWTEAEQDRAKDLLGTPTLFRQHAPGYLVDVAGFVVPHDQTEAELASAQLAELNAHRALVAEADAMARELAEADVDDFHNRDLLRLRRYEATLQRELHRHWEMSQHDSPHLTTDPKVLATISAEFLDPPNRSNEPNPPASALLDEPVSAIPDDPSAPGSALPNEPTPCLEPDSTELNPVETTLPNEPTPPEPTQAPASEPAAVEVEVKVAAPNEAKPGRSGYPIGPPPADPEFARLHPMLQAMLDEGMPDPATLDLDQCREYLAANLDRILQSDHWED